MDSVTARILVQASPAKAFQVFVERINDWWPLEGYSFAPDGTAPDVMHFVPELGGKLYERFANGEEFQIGEVTVWQPGERFGFTWKGEAYAAATQVDVTFEPAAGGTLLTLTHRGWDATGLPEFVPVYEAGWPRVLAFFAALAERG